MSDPDIWNAHTVTTENHHHKTITAVRHATMGDDHLSVWVAIEAIQKDQALVSTALLQMAQCMTPQKRKRMATETLQKRLKQLCLDYTSKDKTLEEYLRSVGATIRLH